MMLSGKPLSKLKDEGEVTSTLIPSDLLMISRKSLTSYDSKVITYDTLRDNIAEYIGLTPVTEYQLNIQYDTSKGIAIGGGEYKAGTTVAIGAFPKDGYIFKRWLGFNGTVTSNPYSFPIYSDMTITAEFELGTD